MGGFFAFGEIKMTQFTVVELFGMLRFVYSARYFLWLKEEETQKP
jgi:hypothetical protein